MTQSPLKNTELIEEHSEEEMVTPKNKKTKIEEFKPSQEKTSAVFATDFIKESTVSCFTIISLFILKKFTWHVCYQR